MKQRSPLQVVRGLGSAKQGTHHFWQQRVTAVALVPLTLWLMVSLTSLAGSGHAGVVAWLGRPLNSLLTLCLVIALLYHAALGVQVVIEDYIHTEWQKIACLILTKFLAILAGLASVLAIIKIFLG